MTPKTLLAGLAAGLVLASSATAENPIGQQRPDAPALSGYGNWPIGVRSMTFTDTGRADVLGSATEVTTYDRPLPVEIWYPAATGTEAGSTYDTVLRDGETPVTLTGRAARDAAPADGNFPMILISHGYPGNRFLMSHLGETLASKGYVTVSVDHTDSTYSDQAAFGSTLVNRPLDQRFVIDSMAALEGEIGAITDTDRIGVIGYSMGGYGALIFAGAGLSETAVTRSEPAAYVPPADLLDQHASGSESHAALIDPRVKAVIAIGPWGRNRDFWDAEGLVGIEKPLMLMAGSADAVSGYDYIREIFAETTGTERLLLTFDHAGHNAAAPMPAPANSYAVSEKLGWASFEHYADAVWDTTRMNNIAQHFATAFMDLHVKGDAEMAPYLDLVETAEDGVWSMTDDVPNADHTYWMGFGNNTARGLRLERRARGE